ncbi:MAG: VIT domain-containing protein, partial [Gemmatimonadota bacterium]
TAIALVLMASSIGTLNAQGWIERPIDQTRLPSSITRISSQVHTTIEGRVARVEVEEQFRNGGGSIAEGTYLYPMPGEAVFTNFSLWMGEQEVRGEIMNADQARGVYEAIVRRLKDPALLTLAGHGLVRAQIFPVQPGETRKVVLRYTMLLDRAGDALRLHYSIGQRDQPRMHAMGDGPRNDGVFSYHLTAPRADDYGTPYSPTHSITTQRVGDHLEISLAPDAAGDVEIFLPLRRGLVGTSVVTHASDGEDGYYMLLLAPRQTADGPAVPRDLSLVVDVSGSMSGEKIQQARAALLQALGTLAPSDRFRLVAFSSTVRSFRSGFTPATSDNLREARRFVDSLEADGGTNIAGALDAVLGDAVAENRLPIVLFLTDGIPSVGEQAPDRIAELAGSRIGRARIFTVGIGTDVNTYLLDRLAKEGRGSAQYVAPGANVEVAVGALLDKLRRPALVNLRVVSAPVDLTQSYPGHLPDLFYGEELVVFGRYHGTGDGQVVVEGERNGRRERFEATGTFAATAPGNEFIPRLWASRRIGELTRQIRLEGASDDLVSQVRELGLRYGILTEYTSYLVQEPGAVVNRNREDRRFEPASNNAPAAAPAAQTGKVAFQRAQESSRMAGASSLAEADVVADEKQASLAGPSQTAELKRIGGRLFVKTGAVWTDAAHRDSLPIVDVAPFTDAYFQLVKALPEIAPWLGAGDQVLIAGRSVGVRISPSGARSWSDKQLETLVKSFRGA